MLKKILKITGIVLLVLVISAFAIPVLFKKQITKLVKKEINKSLAAKVDFSDVSLSFFRHFPKISISLDNISIAGIGAFAKDSLLSAKRVDASVNLFSVIKGKNIKVSGVYLESPRIHLLVNKDGSANWDIAKKDSAAGVTDSSASTFKMTLQEYEINNGYLLYNDETSDIHAEVSGLHHEGSGDFTEDVFTLSTKTKAGAADFTEASIPWLVNAQTNIDADIKIDTRTNTYTFKTDDIVLNNLKLSANGFFQLVNSDTYKMDIQFKSPSNQFKDILSLIPAIYKKDFNNLKTSGSAVFNGFVKGTYSPRQNPAYDVNMAITDGFFQYPDLPKPIKNIQLAMRVSNPDGIMDNAVVDISKGHLEMDNEPFDFKLLIKNPVTSQYIDAVAKGKLDLSNLSKFIKLEANTRLAGLVWADVFAKGDFTAIKQQQGDFTAGGFLDIKDLFYSSGDFPQPIRNGRMKVQVENSGGIADNTRVDISSGHIEIGNDPVDFSGQVTHPVSSLDFTGKAKGSFTLANLKQFMTLAPGTHIAGTLNADLGLSGNKTAILKKEYDKIQITGSAGLNNLKYVSKDYPTGINIAGTQLTFNQKNVTLNSLSGNYLQTNFTAHGEMNNLVGYAMQDQPLAGNLAVTADKMNLNDWMGTDTSSSTAASSAGPFLVPPAINFTIQAKADQVKYDKVSYDNINGVLVLNDQTVKLQNVKTDALDGTIIFNGSYSTKTNKKEPAISINYDVANMDVQKTFYAFNTIQKLMPIGKFLAGKLSSQLSMTGNLGGNMMPLFNSLTGKGNLFLLEGILKKFGPLEKLATLLQIDELKSITLKDVKNYVEFANGKVLVKPFTIHIKDIDMQIGGMHGLDQSIDYIVQMKVPRKYMGTKGNELVGNLVSQATSKGIPLKLGDVVNLNIKVGGSFTDPSFKIDLKEMAGDLVKDLQQQAVNFVKEKADSAKARVKDSLAARKDQVVDDLKKDLKDKVFGNKDSTNTTNPDSTKKKTGETIKNKLKDIFNRKKRAVTDSTKKTP